MTDLGSLLAALGGGAGIAAIITAIFSWRSAGRRTEASVASAMEGLQRAWSGTLEGIQADTAQLRTEVRALEVELADSRREALELRDAVRELTGRIDAALVLLSATTDPSASAAANVLKQSPHRKRGAKKNTSKARAPMSKTP